MGNQMQQRINVELTIVRNSNDEVTFEIVDRSSHLQFFFNQTIT